MRKSVSDVTPENHDQRSPFSYLLTQTDELSEVTIDVEEDELVLESNCYVKADTST